jgi:hypothetical protein
MLQNPFSHKYRRKREGKVSGMEKETCVLHNSHKSSTQAHGSSPSPYDHDAAAVVVAPAPAATTQRWWGGHDPAATVGPRSSGNGGATTQQCASCGGRGGGRNAAVVIQLPWVRPRRSDASHVEVVVVVATRQSDKAVTNAGHGGQRDARGVAQRRRVVAPSRTVMLSAHRPCCQVH